nr:hypothetical protein [Butyrivibrio sp. WCE2006]
MAGLNDTFESLPFLLSRALSEVFYELSESHASPLGKVFSSLVELAEQST